MVGLEIPTISKEFVAFLSSVDGETATAQAPQKSWMKRCIAAANEKLVVAAAGPSTAACGDRGEEPMSEGSAIRALIQTVKNGEVHLCFEFAAGCACSVCVFFSAGESGHRYCGEGQ